MSGPKLDFVYAANHRDDTLTAIDLKTGAAKDYTNKDFVKQPSGFRFLAIAPDGSQLFGQGGIEQLISYKVRGLDVAYQDATPRIAQNGQMIAVSPDGKWVCLPSGGGNYRDLPNHPEISTYTTYVYPTDDLKKPAFVLSQGAYPRLVAFDVKGECIYAQCSGKQLLVFSAEGRKLGEFALVDGREDPQCYLVHPEGRLLIVMTGECMFFVEVPKL